MLPVVRALLTAALALVAPPAACLAAGWGAGAAAAWLVVPLILAGVRIGVAWGVPVALHDPLALASFVAWWVLAIASAYAAARLPRSAPFRVLPIAVVGLAYIVLARLVLVAPTWYVERIDITSASMAPALLPGDAVLAVKPPLMGPVSRGDVVVIRAMADDPLAPPGGYRWIKRVVALPGQTIALRRGRLYVDGEPVKTEEAPARTLPAFTDSCEPISRQARLERHGDRWATVLVGERRAGGTRTSGRVPDGHVYVLGDHRDRSMDSRRAGALPLSAIEGRVLGVASPIAVRPCPRYSLDRLGSRP